jgi:hypothetical protein
MAALVNGSNQLAQTPDGLNISSEFLYVVFTAHYSGSGSGGDAVIMSLSLSRHGVNPFLTHDGHDCACSHTGVDAKEVRAYGLG